MFNLVEMVIWYSLVTSDQRRPKAIGNIHILCTRPEISFSVGVVGSKINTRLVHWQAIKIIFRSFRWDVLLCIVLPRWRSTPDRL